METLAITQGTCQNLAEGYQPLVKRNSFEPQGCSKTLQRISTIFCSRLYVFFGGVGHWSWKKIFTDGKTKSNNCGIQSHFLHTELCVSLLVNVSFFSCHWTSKCNFNQHHTRTTSIVIHSQFSYTVRLIIFLVVLHNSSFSILAVLNFKM